MPFLTIWYCLNILAIVLQRYFFPRKVFQASQNKHSFASKKTSSSCAISVPSRGSHPEVCLGKVILKTCTKFAEEHPCRSVIAIKLQNNFFEVTLWNRCSPVDLLHIFRARFPKYTFVRLLLSIPNTEAYVRPYQTFMMPSLQE